MEEEMDVSQYLEIFLDETNEHLQNLNTQILELESDPEHILHVMGQILKTWTISMRYSVPRIP